MSGAHIFELVSFAKTLMEEDGLEMDEALIESMEKLRSQRELIDLIKGGGKTEEEDVYFVLDEKSEEQVIDFAESEPEKDVDFDKDINYNINSKAGRTISEKTKEKISKAVDNIKKGLDSLVELCDPAVIIEEPEDVEDKSINFEDYDFDKIKNAIVGTLSEVLSNQKEINLADIVEERLNLEKGRIS